MAANLKSSRSTLLNHCFPPFYACYLLKSQRGPRTYIGSTPNPLRRIRQHNQEIAAGARKTRFYGPWDMQLIVHGFPSRLAALQFEWAWQHPFKSRHLRDETGKQMFSRKSGLQHHTRVLHGMILSHPYNTWPLHVKLFTEAAVKAWDSILASSSIELPHGFTYTIELEGVNGQSGQTGSGRERPIDVKDEHFTTMHLAKAQAVMLSGTMPICTICHKPITEFASSPKDIALCPSLDTDCLAVSHLSCLANDFLLASQESTPDGHLSDLLPRGGNCRGCHTYLLWGDVIRGCYRRSKSGSTDVENEDQDDLEDDEAALAEESEASEQEYESDGRPTGVKANKSKGKTKADTAKASGPSRPRGRPRKIPATTRGQREMHTYVLDAQTPGNIEEHSSEGEYFDLDAISIGSEAQLELNMSLKTGYLPVLRNAGLDQIAHKSRDMEAEGESSPPSHALSVMSLHSDEEESKPTLSKGPPVQARRKRKKYVEISD